MREGNRALRYFHSIQGRLTLVMAMMLGLILPVNLFVFRTTSSMVRQINSVFVSNSTIVELEKALDGVERSSYDYLNQRSSSALRDFYRFGQTVRDLTGEFNDRILASETMMLEKNIRGMSETYLKVSEEAVQAKRGRNVEKYREKYAEALSLCRSIKAYIYQLNKLRFSENTENYQYLQHAMTVLESWSLFLIWAAFLLSLFLSIAIIHDCISPLKALAMAADRVAAGDFDVELPAQRSPDEIGIVSDAFGKMLRSIREYIERLRTSLEKEAAMKEKELTMEARLKEAQLKFLQEQINPHFLFNSLNAASQLAVLEEADRTEDFLSHMADYFRYNVVKTGGDASLREELSSVDNYIYILNVRFSGDIHFEKRIEPGIDLSEIRMPSMLLQPVVENAVQHGIHDDHEKGRIFLTVEKMEAEDTAALTECVRVTVSDNGAGIPRKLLENLFSRKERDKGGIALQNVKSRLELYYNQEDLFSIWSDGPGLGTEVIILLPLPDGGNQQEEARQMDPAGS